MSNTLQRPELPKRFYTDVGVEERDGEFEIRLDGRPVRTPARSALSVPQRAVAEAVAEEWRGQATHIDPSTMPMTRLVNTVVDGIRPDAGPTREDLSRYAETDLLAYRAESPERLVANQSAEWDPIVSWAEARFSVSFHVAAGVMHVTQPTGTLSALRARLEEEADPFRLAAIHQITTLTGSLLLALAVAEGRISDEDAWRLAHVDEDWNISLWGEDEEARARREARFLDMQAAGLILRG